MKSGCRRAMRSPAGARWRSPSSSPRACSCADRCGRSASPARLSRVSKQEISARARERRGRRNSSIFARRINRLAEALSSLSAANRQLIERVLDAHDEERKAIAHELHDELGPHLFALRANAALLADRLGRRRMRAPPKRRSRSAIRWKPCSAKIAASSPTCGPPRSRSSGWPRRCGRWRSIGEGPSPTWRST